MCNLAVIQLCEALALVAEFLMCLTVSYDCSTLDFSWIFEFGLYIMLRHGVLFDICCVFGT